MFVAGWLAAPVREPAAPVLLAVLGTRTFLGAAGDTAELLGLAQAKAFAAIGALAVAGPNGAVLALQGAASHRRALLGLATRPLGWYALAVVSGAQAELLAGLGIAAAGFGRDALVAVRLARTLIGANP
jgi:hypothetical protein